MVYSEDVGTYLSLDSISPDSGSVVMQYTNTCYIGFFRSSGSRLREPWVTRPFLYATSASLIAITHSSQLVLVLGTNEYRVLGIRVVAVSKCQVND